jgi:hypothetical protein
MAPPKTKDEDILSALEIYAKYGGNATIAARAAGMARSSFQHYILEARTRGLGKEIFENLNKPKFVLKGQSTLTNGAGDIEARWDKTKLAGRDDELVEHVPDPKRAVRISTLYDQQGKVAQQWITEKPEDFQREQMWRELAADLAKSIPRAKAQPAPKGTDADLLAVYPVGDHHMGMLAWGHETGGADWDVEIAERTLDRASSFLIETAPKCDHALIAFLGDFMHYDSWAAVTPAHGNLLDADGRFPKMVRAALRSMRKMIEYALGKHKKVDVIVEIGNHDPASSIFLMECLSSLYEKEPRVRVDTSPSHYHYFEWGNLLLGTHHGHGCKPDKLPGIMAADRPEAWGRTKFHHWITGHIHNESRKDFAACVWESMRVLAPVDGWAAKNGYRGYRDMKAIVFHREHGEVVRHTVNPGMFERRAA